MAIGLSHYVQVPIYTMSNFEFHLLMEEVSAQMILD